MRISKKPEVRKKELLESAARLFIEKGYTHTSVNDIISDVGVAKGTFYYYFKSKEEVIDVIIDYYMDRIIASAEPIVNNPQLDALSKLREVLAKQYTCDLENMSIFIELNKIRDVDVGEKFLKAEILKLAPVFTGIIEQGNRDGIFAAEYILETMQIFIAGINALLYSKIFAWSKEEYLNRIKAVQYVAEKLTGACPGSFSFLYEIWSSIPEEWCSEGSE